MKYVIRVRFMRCAKCVKCVNCVKSVLKNMCEMCDECDIMCDKCFKGRVQSDSFTNNNLVWLVCYEISTVSSVCNV